MPRCAWCTAGVWRDGNGPTAVGKALAGNGLAGIDPTRAFVHSGHSSRPGCGADIGTMRSRPTAEDEETSLELGLTRVEDNELRRLNWMAQRGRLTQAMSERMIELRLRDRRKTIRRPKLVADD